ncbi:MFS transporter [Thiomicrospira microaerophila]|uniref:MFS transporter n=1 Tax=Thiomicrospira microaerophila TaxID=406020 RepID=UPI00200EAABF|nr:MFS transporter [Thiomicrospira microaerophila]UQB42300.1 MFS transporter [Thiomicrospira microaerophila]
MSFSRNLISQSKFQALFIVQFFGAFNDNLFKNALVMLITYRIMVDSDAGLAITLAAGLFILPFFLFSPYGGYLADRWDKVWLMRKIKLAEVLIMLMASLALVSGEMGLMLMVLFLLGLQSAFFGPIKYSILPEQVPLNQLMQANAWFSGSTFVAILIGTVIGGLVVLMDGGIFWLSGLMLGLALLGYMASRMIPLANASQQKIETTPEKDAENNADNNQAWWTIFKNTFQHFADGRGYIVVAISFLWFIGASLLSQFPMWVKDFLYADEQVAVLFMALFALGFALGAWLINQHLKGRTQLRYQPFLLLLMAVALVDAIWVTSQVPQQSQLLSLTDYLSQWPGNRVMFDLLLLALFAGAYAVPLYTQLQRQVVSRQRAQAFALNNVMNALFMVASALLIMLGYSLNFNWLEVAAGLVFAMLIMAIIEWRWRNNITLFDH